MVAAVKTDYDRYLKSGKWLRLRGVLCPLGKPCPGCRIVLPLELHHVCYDRLGREIAEDLCPLCRNCHERLHADLDSRWPTLRTGLQAAYTATVFPILFGRSMAEALQAYGWFKLWEQIAWSRQATWKRKTEAKQPAPRKPEQIVGKTKRQVCMACKIVTPRTVASTLRPLCERCGGPLEDGTKSKRRLIRRERTRPVARVKRPKKGRSSKWLAAQARQRDKWAAIREAAGLPRADLSQPKEERTKRPRAVKPWSAIEKLMR